MSGRFATVLGDDANTPPSIGHVLDCDGVEGETQLDFKLGTPVPCASGCCATTADDEELTAGAAAAS